MEGGGFLIPTCPASLCTWSVFPDALRVLKEGRLSFLFPHLLDRRTEHDKEMINPT